jgi:homoserine kinase
MSLVTPTIGAHARVFAPGGIGNIGPGLDILGCAVTGPGDAVTARVTAQWGVRLDGPGHAELPRDAARHASAIAASEVLRRAGLDCGLSITLEKGLPLAGGQGGSAASAVAGAAAANAALDNPLDRETLIACALVAEAAVSGHHADNVIPSLTGGIVLIRRLDPVEFLPLPVPPSLHFVLVHPDQRLPTHEARGVLPSSVNRAEALAQAANIAWMVAALHRSDVGAFGRAIQDAIAEPVRAPLLPGFTEAKTAALETGAAGCSISGAGPSAFAVTDDPKTGSRIGEAMCAAYARRGVAATWRVAQVDQLGARLEG